MNEQENLSMRLSPSINSSSKNLNRKVEDLHAWEK
jgi:hypothetical protein